MVHLFLMNFPSCNTDIGTAFQSVLPHFTESMSQSMLGLSVILFILFHFSWKFAPCDIFCVRMWISVCMKIMWLYNVQLM